MPPKKDILPKASTSTHSNCLSHLNNLVRWVSCLGHPSQNTELLQRSHWMQRSRIDCDKAKILSELSNEGVTDMQHKHFHRHSKLTFHLLSVSKHLRIGFIRVPVTVHIPNSLQDIKCEKFGHASRTCVL